MVSDDEIGGYAPTTPGPAQKKTVPPARGAQRPVAGPSKLKVGPPKKGTRKDADIVHSEGVVERIMISSSEDEVTRQKNSATKAKGKANQTAEARTNGVAKSKGKAKEDPPPPPTSDAMDVDDPQTGDSEPIPVVRPKSKSSSKAAVTPDATTTVKRDKREVESLKREIERLRKRLEDADARNRKLSEQLERVMKIRETEPEEALRARVDQYEATTRAQENLIQEQTHQLAHLKVLNGDSDQIHQFPFMSRDAAEADRKVLHNKVKSLSEAVKSKDTKIAELQRENNELQVQLENEIKMAQMQLQQKANPPKSGLSRDLNADKDKDKKKDEVIALYERLTNVLIVHVEHSAFQQHNLPEILYKCIFTYIDDPTGRPTGSDPCISFELLETWARADGEDIADDVTKDELEPKMLYTPRDLDKQTEAFRHKLGFFGDGFLFTPSQSAVFLRSLAETLAPPKQPPSQDSNNQPTTNGQGEEQQDEEVVEVMVKHA